MTASERKDKEEDDFRFVLKAVIDERFARVEDKIAERDKQYTQRFDAQEKAVVAALAASKEAVSAAFNATEKAVGAALAAAKEAVQKAEAASEKRFESVNEFRNQQRDIIATFLPRNEFDTLVRTMSGYLPRSEFDALAKRFEQLAGANTGKKDTWGYIVAAIGVVIALVSMYIGFKS